MAVLALGLVGAGISAGLGFGAAAGWIIGTTIGNQLMAPDIEGPRLGDLRVTGTEYGQTIPWVAGSPRISGQIIWSSAKRETANTQSAKGGPEQTTYTYDCDLVILLTENEIVGVSRVWSNGELVMGDGKTKSGVWSSITVYTGSEDQLPDPTYEAAVGVGNAPAYRGRGYVVITGLQLGNGGQIPNLTFEIGTFQPDIYATKSSYLALGLVTRRDSDALDPYNIAYTDEPTWDSNFSEFGSNALLYYKYYTNATAPGDSLDSVGSKIMPISVTNQYKLVANNGFWSGDMADITVQFLNGAGAAVATISALDAGAPEFTHYFRYGTTSATTLLTNNIVTQGVFTFSENLLTYTNQGGYGFGGAAPGFTLACDALSIRSVHITLGRFRSTYTGGVQNPSAVAYLQKVPTSGEEGGSWQSFNTVDGVTNYLMQRAGYEVSDYSVTDIVSEKPLRGFAIGQLSNTRSSIDMLRNVWLFEVSKSDKIYFKTRSTTPVATITWEELGVSSESSGSRSEPFPLTIANELEIPAQVALSYPNITQDYQTSTEHSDRLLSGQESTTSVSVAVAMTPAEAKAVADAQLFDLVAGKTTVSIAVALKYSYIEPGDIINVINFDGREYRLRVNKRTDEGIILKFDCVLDDVGALVSASVTDGGYSSQASVKDLAPSLWKALDIPILKDADDSTGYYVAISPNRTEAEDEWRGSTFLRSWNDNDYSVMYDTSSSSVIGTCSTVLGNWDGRYVFDNKNTLTVTTRGELASSTKSAMITDGEINVMLVGSEIIRFVSAELIGTTGLDKQYRLSGLLRGYRGTEWATNIHGASETFVLLDSSLRRVSSETNQIGVLRYHKAVTFRNLISNVTSDSFTDTGVALKPFSVANPKAVNDGSGNLVLSWQRRTRKSYKYGGTPGVSVPLGETIELYRIRVYDGATLVRTATVTTPAWVYTSSNISSDGFIGGDPITLEISQFSEVMGYGYTNTITGVAP